MIYDMLFLQVILGCSPWIWLAMLLPLLLGALLGWLLSRRSGNAYATAGGNGDNRSLQARINALEKELADWRYKHEEKDKLAASLRTQVGELEADKASLQARLSTAGSGPDVIEKDNYILFDKNDNTNLQAIEGVTPELEAVLKRHGVNTWGDFAALDRAQLETYIREANIDPDVLDTAGMLLLAAHARDGKWDAFMEQRLHVDQYYLPLDQEEIGFDISNKTNLQAINGVTPELEAVLKANGINTWGDLAKLDRATLRGLVAEAEMDPDRFNYNGTLAMATLARDGRWNNFKLARRHYLGLPLFTDESGAGMNFDTKDNSRLTAIYGITPELEATLKGRGIRTWAEVAMVSQEELRRDMEQAGIDPDGVDMESILQMAALARDGKWEEFKTARFKAQQARIEALNERFGQKDLSVVDYNALFSNDNLQIIEGIGPKVEAVLKGAGIMSWEDLADQSPDELRAILDVAGSAYKMMDPVTWPKQARLAVEGNWNELIAYQRFLDEGRAGQGDFETPSKVSELAAKSVGFISDDKTDLTVIEGIGPKILELLKNNGIRDWHHLANTTPDRLREILGAQGDRFRFIDPATWPIQAKMADAGNWKDLKAYQDYLVGGVDPGSNQAVEPFRLPSGGINYAAIFPQNDNLQIIEGIGPKIEEVLKKAGVNTWTELAVKTTEELKTILEEAGPAYRMHDPSSWPRQAKLAGEGKWNELVEYQKFLDTGRETTGDFETKAKAEAMAMKILGFTNNPDDLKVIEGIGPKIEELLKSNGINNWSDLAGASVQRLQDVLDQAGDNYRLANPSTWPRQAELAAANKWDELKNYQDFLSGGVDPNQS